MRETRVFKRDLYINDPDPNFTNSKQKRKSALWAIDADGEMAYFEEGFDLARTSKNGYTVARDWTEPLSSEV